ncbi:hypothetical protein [Porphyromonas gingivicanis]|uniref:hypothetical protein n=1 Tax=Porphyromonas gingivicanis TaxID=266762 RepID=UPI0006850DC4|nr:hypothetical protein [Porphyromonas gingivicanis]
MRRTNIFFSLAKVSIHQWLGTLAIFLLLSSMSCGNKKATTSEHGFSVDSAYSMLTKDVDVLVSDSGETRYRLKAKECTSIVKLLVRTGTSHRGLYPKK